MFILIPSRLSKYQLSEDLMVKGEIFKVTLSLWTEGMLAGMQKFKAKFAKYFRELTHVQEVSLRQSKH